jgi:hypothetical protein
MARGQLYFHNSSLVVALRTSNMEHSGGRDPDATSRVARRHLLAEIYSEDGSIRADFLDRIDRHIEKGDVEALAEAVAPLHESELGDLIETLEADSRRQNSFCCLATGSTSRR